MKGQRWDCFDAAWFDIFRPGPSVEAWRLEPDGGCVSDGMQLLAESALDDFVRFELTAETKGMLTVRTARGADGSRTLLPPLIGAQPARPGPECTTPSARERWFPLPVGELADSWFTDPACHEPAAVRWCLPRSADDFAATFGQAPGACRRLARFGEEVSTLYGGDSCTARPATAISTRPHFVELADFPEAPQREVGAGRLRARHHTIEGRDRVDLEVELFDTELDRVCEPAESDAGWRCVPNATDVFSVRAFEDPQCQRPALALLSADVGVGDLVRTAGDLFVLEAEVDRDSLFSNTGACTPLPGWRGFRARSLTPSQLPLLQKKTP